MKEKPSTLSEILEENVDPKYTLSARACEGILNRAAKRGKGLPEVLERALKKQIERPKREENGSVGNPQN
jgi:hypothetical protein